MVKTEKSKHYHKVIEYCLVRNLGVFDYRANYRMSDGKHWIRIYKKLVQDSIERCLLKHLIMIKHNIPLYVQFHIYKFC